MRMVIDGSFNVTVKEPGVSDLVISADLVRSAAAGNTTRLREFLRNQDGICLCCVERIVKDAIEAQSQAYENVWEPPSSLLPFGKKLRRSSLK